MKKSYKIITYLIIVIGFVHISVTPAIFNQFTMQVGWFIGVGLLAFTLGFLNIANWRSNDDLLIRRLTIGANMATVFWGVMNLFVDKSPQGYLIVALFTYLALASYVVGKESAQKK
ncbi:MAG: hypothetical protein DWQ05_21640 [Calditrichaeota bacterium]|nr:MAG: hypothetical protein DWQ05_21640 [Calditrichota bacterium]